MAHSQPAPHCFPAVTEPLRGSQLGSLPGAAAAAGNEVFGSPDGTLCSESGTAVSADIPETQGTALPSELIAA